MAARYHGWSARVAAGAGVLVAALPLFVACHPTESGAGATVPVGARAAVTAGTKATGRGGPQAGAPTGAWAAARAGDIHARVAPVVAFVETPLGTGSAVLVPPGVLLTNAHVVWPEDEVRVTFADGSEYAAARVSHVDLMADLALIDIRSSGGPPSGLEPARIGDGSSLPIGSDVFLVGYPGEADSFPRPALSRGVVSQHRDFPELAVRYIQTDAAIAGGQSGGAMVDVDGAVVGITSMTFGDAAFALAVSAPDAMDRVARMLAGEDVDGLAERDIPRPADRARVRRADLATPWDEAVFAMWPEYGDVVEVRVTSSSDAVLEVLDPYGEVVATVDESASGDESAEIAVASPGPFFVVTYLDEGGTVGFVPDAVIDSVDAPDSAPRLEPKVTGPLGLTLEAQLTAERGGRHVLTVRDLDGIGTGGYTLTWMP